MTEINETGRGGRVSEFKLVRKSIIEVKGTRYRGVLHRMLSLFQCPHGAWGVIIFFILLLFSIFFFFSVYYYLLCVFFFSFR